MNKDILAKATTLRRELHAHPELSYQEVWTKQHLMDFLKENTKVKLVDKGKWFYACYLGADGKDPYPIGFRADFDALPMEDEIDAPWKSQIPGCGHKCGHDGHVAALCAFAMELEAQAPKRDVYLVFQHAEETGQGACECGDFVKETGIKEIYSCHNTTGLPYGTVGTRLEGTNCASMGMNIVMTGAPTHASQPELGKNPSLAICDTANEIMKIADQSRFEKLVLATICEIKVGEHAFGIAASKGCIGVTLRAEHDKDMYQIRDEVIAFAEKRAAEDGLTVDFSYEDVFPDTTNTPEQAMKVINAAKSIGLPAVMPEQITRGSEDFGWFLKQCPGAEFTISAGDRPAIHTAAFDFMDELMGTMVDVYFAILAQ